MTTTVSGHEGAPVSPGRHGAWLGYLKLVTPSVGAAYLAMAASRFIGGGNLGEWGDWIIPALAFLVNFAAYSWLFMPENPDNR